MKKLRRLKDEYRFPGFIPLMEVKGIFGDPKAVLISLIRRRKKRAAAVVARAVGRITTNDLDGFVTCRVAINGCIWHSTCAGLNAQGVVP